MMEESLPALEAEFSAIKKVSTKFRISPEAIRRWKRQSEIDSRLHPGVSSQGTPNCAVPMRF
jgi:hypothetical protein